MEAISDEIRQFIENELGRDLREIEDEASLLEAGILDSLGVLQLVSFIEQRYGVQIPDEDLMPERFGSIEDITGLVADHLAISR